MRAEPLRRAAPAAFVGLLVAWSVVEAVWRLGVVGPAARPDALVVLWAAAIPLPLLAVRRWPTAAGLLVIALLLGRVAADARVPGSAFTSLVTVVTLFAVESQRSSTAFPTRGIALGLLLLGGTAALDAFDVGAYAHPPAPPYPALVLFVVGGVGAGVALRDRRAETDRLEAEVRVTGDRAAGRLQAALAAERSRIAAEIDGTVALLLDRVRPLAETAATERSAQRIVEAMRTAEAAAMEAMTEMRRALRLLRTPGNDVEFVRPAPAPRHTDTRLRTAAVALALVLLLAAFGLFEQWEVRDAPALVVPQGAHVGIGGRLAVPAPALGPIAPFVMAVLGVLALAFRARWPLAAVVTVSVLLVVRMELHWLSYLTWTQYYVAGAAAFLGAAHARSVPRALAAGAVAAAAAAACMAMEQGPYVAADYVFTVALPAVAVAAGLLMRETVALAKRSRVAREELDRLHAEEARERLAAERVAAARDLHDVIGHAVTVVGMQAAVARRYAEFDADRARESAAIVAQVAADAERDLGRLTEYLDAAPPVDVAALVERWRAAGLPVELDDRLGAVEPSLPVVQVAFRIIQEALTNAARHGGHVPTTVTLGADGPDLVIEVVNALGSGDPGRRRGGGIAGMRERAAIYGGSVEAGRDGAGGWAVRAQLPMHRPSGSPARPHRTVTAGLPAG